MRTQGFLDAHHSRIIRAAYAIEIISGYQTVNSTDQARSSPASRSNPVREGLSQGRASNAFATSNAAGEK